MNSKLVDRHHAILKIIAKVINYSERKLICSLDLPVEDLSSAIPVNMLLYLEQHCNELKAADFNSFIMWNRLKMLSRVQHFDYSLDLNECELNYKKLIQDVSCKHRAELAFELGVYYFTEKNIEEAKKCMDHCLLLDAKYSENLVLQGILKVHESHSNPLPADEKVELVDEGKDCLEESDVTMEEGEILEEKKFLNLEDKINVLRQIEISPSIKLFPSLKAIAEIPFHRLVEQLITRLLHNKLFDDCLQVLKEAVGYSDSIEMKICYCIYSSFVIIESGLYRKIPELLQSVRTACDELIIMKPRICNFDDLTIFLRLIAYVSAFDGSRPLLLVKSCILSINDTKLAWYEKLFASNLIDKISHSYKMFLNGDEDLESTIRKDFITKELLSDSKLLNLVCQFVKWMIDDSWSQFVAKCLVSAYLENVENFAKAPKCNKVAKNIPIASLRIIKTIAVGDYFTLCKLNYLLNEINESKMNWIKHVLYKTDSLKCELCHQILSDEDKLFMISLLEEGNNPYDFVINLALSQYLSPASYNYSLIKKVQGVHEQILWSLFFDIHILQELVENNSDSAQYLLDLISQRKHMKPSKDALFKKTILLMMSLYCCPC